MKTINTTIKNFFKSYWSIVSGLITIITFTYFIYDIFVIDSKKNKIEELRHQQLLNSKQKNFSYITNELIKLKDVLKNYTKTLAISKKNKKIIEIDNTKLNLSINSISNKLYNIERNINNTYSNDEIRSIKKLRKTLNEIIIQKNSLENLIDSKQLSKTSNTEKNDIYEDSNFEQINKKLFVQDNYGDSSTKDDTNITDSKSEYFNINNYFDKKKSNINIDTDSSEQISTTEKTPNIYTNFLNSENNVSDTYTHVYQDKINVSQISVLPPTPPISTSSSTACMLTIFATSETKERSVINNFFCVLGISSQSQTKLGPPPPPTYACLMELYEENFSGPFIVNIQSYKDVTKWYLKINPRGNVGSPMVNKTTIISWDSSQVGSNTFVIKQGFNSEGEIIVEDVKNTSYFEVTGINSSQWFTVYLKK